MDRGFDLGQPLEDAGGALDDGVGKVAATLMRAVLPASPRCG